MWCSRGALLTSAGQPPAPFGQGRVAHPFIPTYLQADHLHPVKGVLDVVVPLVAQGLQQTVRNKPAAAAADSGQRSAGVWWVTVTVAVGAGQGGGSGIPHSPAGELLTVCTFVPGPAPCPGL